MFQLSVETWVRLKWTLPLKVGVPYNNVTQAFVANGFWDYRYVPLSFLTLFTRTFISDEYILRLQIVVELETFSCTQLPWGHTFSHAPLRDFYAIEIKQAVKYCPRLTLACVRCTGITHAPGIRDTHFRRIGIDISIGFEKMPEACNLPSLGRIFLFKARVCLRHRLTLTSFWMCCDIRNLFVDITPSN